jgi:tRNA1(Val) A37 N6-methylase TrmN6
VSCCHCQATEKQFDDAFAARDLKRYRKKGPDKTTRLILEAVREQVPSQSSLLDVGAGIGVLHHELLGEQVSRAIHVEASPAFVAAARGEAERRGHGDRITFTHGDFVGLAEGLPQADIVALDRVVCCYPEYESLVRLSAAKATRLYLASFPRWRWFVRLGNALENAIRKLKRNEFRTFVHPPAEIEALLARAGLRCCHRRRTWAWEVVAFRPAMPESEAVAGAV